MLQEDNFSLSYKEITKPISQDYAYTKGFRKVLIIFMKYDSNSKVRTWTTLHIPLGLGFVFAVTVNLFYIINWRPFKTQAKF